MGEIFRPHTNTKKWLVSIGVVLCIAAIGGAYYGIFVYKHAKPAPAAYNPHQDQVSRLEKSGPPVEPQLQISYYSQLGQQYEALQDTGNALKNYLKAQSIADATRPNRIVFYMSIAALYKQKHDTAKAKQYYEKEIAYLRLFIQDHPEQAESTNKTIATVENAIKTL